MASNVDLLALADSLALNEEQATVLYDLLIYTQHADDPISHAAVNIMLRSVYAQTTMAKLGREAYDMRRLACWSKRKKARKGGKE